MSIARNERSIDWTLNRVLHYGDRFVNAYLDNEWCSDMAFYVPKDDRLVPAHSLIIAAASPLLERLCSDADKFTGSIVIAVPEMFDFDDFELVLEYLYQGGAVDPDFEDMDPAKIYLLSAYFELPVVMELCLEHMTKTLSLDNVCSHFEHLHNINHPLQKSCLELIQANMRQFLSDGSVMRLSDGALATLLAEDRLHINREADLMGPMVKWAEEKCQEQHLEPTGPNLRQVMEPRLALIRFTTMKFEEFGEHVLKTKHELLNTLEIGTIVQRIAKGTQHCPTPFTIGSHTVSQKPRKFQKTIKKAQTYNLGYMTICRSTSVETIEAPFPNKKTWLTGLKIGDKNPPTFNILNTLKGNEIIHKYFRGQSRAIRFAQPLPLSLGTNGKWVLKFQTTEDNQSLDLFHIINHEKECLVRGQDVTCLESVSFNYELLVD